MILEHSAVNDRNMEMMRDAFSMMWEQSEQSRRDNQQQLEMIMHMQQNDQRAALEELERKSERARLDQEENFRRLENERKIEAEQKLREMQVILVTLIRI